MVLVLIILFLLAVGANLLGYILMAIPFIAKFAMMAVAGLIYGIFMFFSSVFALFMKGEVQGRLDVHPDIQPAEPETFIEVRPEWLHEEGAPGDVPEKGSAAPDLKSTIIALSWIILGLGAVTVLLMLFIHS